MIDIEAIRALTTRQREVWASKGGPAPVSMWCDDVDQLCDEVERLRAENSRLLADANRLDAWLRKIDGGENPCTDESQLRQWAYDATVLGKEAPDA